jgi:zinc protease
MLRFVVVSTCLMFILALNGCATSRTHVGLASEPVVVKRAVRAYNLRNGVRLLIKDTDKGDPTSIQLWVTGGNIADPPGKAGLSHFVEHMLFTGSLHLPPGKAENYIESMGGRMSGHTGRDFSYMGVTIPGPGWERALDILFDLVSYPSFLPDQIEKERKVVGLEIKRRAIEADTALMDGFFGLAYREHPYKNPITGGARELAGFTRDDVVECYRRTYVPSNMTVAVVGGIVPADVKAAVEKTFGGLPPARFASPKAPDEPYQVIRRTKEDTGAVKLTYMALGWRVAAAADEDIYPLEVLSAALGYGRGSRLYMELRERKGLVSDLKTELYPLRDPGLLAVHAYTTEDNVAPVTDEILRQVNKLKDEVLSEAELARAISNIVASHLLNDESAEDQAYALGYWATVYGGKDPARYIQNIRKVTALDVRRVAQKYLGEGNYTVYVIKPGSQSAQGRGW